MGEGDRHLRADLEQLNHPGRPFVEIDQERADPTQVRGLGQRALHPAHDRHLAADMLAEKTDRGQPIAHPAACVRRGPPKAGQVGGIGQQRRLAQRQVILREFDPGAEVGRLAVGVGDRLDDIEIEGLLHRQVGLAEDAMIEIVTRQRLADGMGREGHEDVEVERAINCLARA